MALQIRPVCIAATSGHSYVQQPACSVVDGNSVEGRFPQGSAAAQLCCSRQHVVDLCDGGKLPVVRKGGSHRYVRRSDVLTLLGPSLTRDQERSRWLHEAIAGHHHLGGFTRTSQR
jgi:hypothetical protein